MSTFMANPQNIERKWYLIDAAGKPLGRVAAAAATILNGKNKPTYTPHEDCGDHVIIINCDKAVLTGNKINTKVRRWPLAHRLDRPPQGIQIFRYDGKRAREGDDLCDSGNAPEEQHRRKFAHKTQSL